MLGIFRLQLARDSSLSLKTISSGDNHGDEFKKKGKNKVSKINFLIYLLSQITDLKNYNFTSYLYLK